MLRILGSPRKLCDGVSRRDMLRVGTLGLAGMTLDQMAAWRTASANQPIARPKSFGRAKSIILIHLYGSPSQLEWVDPKPDAPLEIRGELGSINSSLPGCRVCELLPNYAKVMDRCTVLRSMTHPYPIHGVAYALTGIPTIQLPMELNPRDARHWPFFGSAVEYVEAKAAGENPQKRNVPANIALPYKFSSRRSGEVPRSGPYAAFLGNEFDPVWADFVGTAYRGLKKLLVIDQPEHECPDPYMGVEPNCYFQVPAATDFQPGITLDRMRRRRSLLEQFEDARADLASSSTGQQFDRYRKMTYELLESNKLRQALDVRLEPPRTRELYGQTLFGQSLLAARRLVEAGGRVVTVFWDEFGRAGSGWDTHFTHFARMKQELCPGLDQAWYGLIMDMESRGLLDDTLIVCTSEHGRSPKLTEQHGGGRDHWSRVYSTVLAGGGVKRGSVVGASDKQGGDVLDRPISPKDLLATMYHLLGIDHHLLVHDALGRPLPLVEGHVIEEALL